MSKRMIGFPPITEDGKWIVSFTLFQINQMCEQLGIVPYYFTLVGLAGEIRGAIKRRGLKIHIDDDGEVQIIAGGEDGSDR